MKKIICLFLVGFLFSHMASAQIHIIPQPVEVKPASGTFTLLPGTVIGYPAAQGDVKKVADYLSALLTAPTGYALPVRPGSAARSAGNIYLELLVSPEPALGKEGYRLQSGPNGVLIQANEVAGLFYGVQTFRQLLPAQIESRQLVKDVRWTAPAVSVMDHPRFGWRGLMLDVSRHFFTKEEVKRYIDDMVKFKYNVLHFHLTDDQGWRLEIKSLPKLTEVGAWNVKKVGRFNYFSKPELNEPRDYGGFYTHEDIRELVQYAKDRHVEILPEIDVPGHSLAAIASYPELTSTPGTYQVNSGEKFMEWPPSGHFYGLIDNALNPASEKVYTFLDKVFTEVAQLFPFAYIHMGGDETARNFWEKSADIKALMASEKLKNLDEVQAYFVGRVNQIINAKGKKMIGWDEILQGGLVPGAAVMSWRGMEGGITAAKKGHEVVMSPTTHVYIDYMQGDASMEPPVYASLRMKKAYSFEPLPEGVDPKFIKGGQANLWTEQVYNLRQAQYMTWPRGLAVAEAVWSPASARNWTDFVRRVEHQFPRFDHAQTKIAPSMYEPDVKAFKSGTNGLAIEMIPEIDGLDLHYSFDNSYPDAFYPKYGSKVEVPKDADNLRVATYRNGKQVGRFMTIPITELRRRAGYK
jgi:hexosaminidase